VNNYFAVLLQHATDMTQAYAPKSARLSASNLERYLESGVGALENVVDLERGY
jgi:hypothetical protein